MTAVCFNEPAVAEWGPPWGLLVRSRARADLAKLRSNAYTRSYLDANLTTAELSAATRALTGDR